MKMLLLLLASVLLAACSSPTVEPDTPAPAGQPAPTSTAARSADAAASTTVSASGIVESVDTGARAITIAHEPVQALEWPAMTMTFRAPDADLASIRPGDRVAFEFTVAGMEGTIIRISRQ